MKNLLKSIVPIALSIMALGLVAGCGQSEGEAPKASTQELERQKTEAAGTAASGQAGSADTANLGQSKPR